MKNLDKLRSDIKSLKSEEKALIEAPVSTAEIENRIDVWLDQQTETARAFFSRASVLASPKQTGPGWPFADDAISENRRLSVALVAFFNREGLRNEALRVALEAAPKEKQVPLAQRPDRLQQVRERIYRLGVMEEQQICELEAAGLSVSRRADADGYAVLGIAHPDYSTESAD